MDLLSHPSASLLIKLISLEMNIKMGHALSEIKVNNGGILKRELKLSKVKE
jgi:hypothetical protein